MILTSTQSAVIASVFVAVGAFLLILGFASLAHKEARWSHPSEYFVFGVLIAALAIGAYFMF